MSTRETPEDGRCMKPEAIAMRRLVSERGFWLSPILSDHPLPKITKWEASVDLMKLAGQRVGDTRKTPETLARSGHIQNGGGRSSTYKPTTYAEIQEKQKQLNQQKLAAYHAKRAARLGTAPPPLPIPPGKPEPRPPAAITTVQWDEPPPRRKRNYTVDTEKAQLRREIAAMSPEEKAARRRQLETEMRKRNREKKRDPVRAAKLERIRNFTPEEKLEHRQEQREKARARHAAKLAADEQARAELAARRRIQQRERARAAGIPENPNRWKDLPTAKHLREEAIAAEAIEAEQRRREAVIEREQEALAAAKAKFLHKAVEVIAATARKKRQDRSNAKQSERIVRTNRPAD